ncbi:polysaccharide deacetylase family protein [Paenibacillus sp. NPDC058071]|uniref:polysaccharide deacetylase family protein n=1 Tax=Paenibacillus sp. NPDC058071 TaxID=3346326 RepID=UPI0036D972D5
MGNRTKLAAVVICMAVLFTLAFSEGGLRAYVRELKQGAETASAKPRKPAALPEAELAGLRERIAAEAEQHRVAPIDARIDRIWKAIPGYNGIEVDAQATFDRTVATGALSPIQFVYKEVPPKISLQSLGTYPVYRGNPEKKMAAIMINVAWGEEYLPSMLESLAKENVKATFFLDGSWLNKNGETAKRIQAEGHEMSNHAYSHPNMSELGKQAAYEQISKTEALLKSTLGASNRWFAPPSGDFNQTTLQVAAEQGLMTVLWTVDTIDWQKPPPETILRRVANKLTPGALILMHPTASSRDALPGIIRYVKEQGYALGTVSDTLSPSRIPSSVEPNL